MFSFQNVRAALVWFLWTISMASLGAADVSIGERYPLLTQLTLPESTLPPGCAVAKGQPPIPGLENRAVTTNAQMFVLVDAGLTERFKTNVQAMYYGVYREKGELGIFGWAFQDEPSASEFHTKLQATHHDRFKVWRSQHYVICLWRDTGTTDECFQHFVRFLQKQLSAAPKEEG